MVSSRSSFANLSKVLAILGLSSLIFSGCSSVQPVNGILYSDVGGPVTSTTLPLGPKHGTACASSILNLIATGDATIEAAAKSAGIAQVSQVDQHSSNIWFLYTKYCVDVWGWAARGSAPAPSMAPGGGTPPPPPAKPPGASINPTGTGIPTAENQ